MVAHRLLNVDLAPGGTWARSYTVVKLEKLCADDRASRVKVRKTCDVVFPESISFPLRQRLALSGAMLDSAAPGPLVRGDAEETWEPELSDDDGHNEEDEDDDGRMNENEPQLRAESVEMAMSLDPEHHPGDDPAEDRDNDVHIRQQRLQTYGLRDALHASVQFRFAAR